MVIESVVVAEAVGALMALRVMAVVLTASVELHGPLEQISPPSPSSSQYRALMRNWW